jgi:hypothetical protein
VEKEMKRFQIITVIILWRFFSGCSIDSNFYIINISQVPVRISYQLKSLSEYEFFEKSVSKFKVIREDEDYSIGVKDSSFVYTDTDLLYEIMLYPNEALLTGSSSYNNLLKNTQYCESEFSNLVYLSIIKTADIDSINITTDSLLITNGLMCSVIEEIKKSYAFVIR